MAAVAPHNDQVALARDGGTEDRGEGIFFTQHVFQANSRIRRLDLVQIVPKALPVGLGLRSRHGFAVGDIFRPERFDGMEDNQSGAVVAR
jgi:hypothetical protein